MIKLNAKIATIGDEILIGQILDTNSQWLASELQKLGIQVTEMLSLADSREAIEGLLSRTSQEVLIITGGLGPTKDDITKKTIADFFGDQLVLNDDILDRLADIYASRGRELNELNKTQALIPSQAVVLNNNYGTASGMVFKNGKQVIISLPGVPREMKGIMTEYGFDYLQENFQSEKTSYLTFHTVGIPESDLAIKLSNWEASLHENDLGLAFLPNLGKVRLRISHIKKENEAYVKVKVKELYDLIGDYIFGVGDTSLNKEVATALRDKNITIATAESCTGGNIAKNLTELTGSSSFFKGSIVSYSNDIKVDVLGVPQNVLDEFGAVSEETVVAMSSSVKQKLNTNASIAASGIAGPTGGTSQKPVGTVWVAVRLGDYLETKVLNLSKNRAVNIELATTYSLEMLWRICQNKK